MFISIENTSHCIFCTSVELLGPYTSNKLQYIALKALAHAWPESDGERLLSHKLHFSIEDFFLFFYVTT